MRLLSSGARPDGDRPGDSAIEQYLSLWEDGEPSLERFWARVGPTHSLAVLGTLVKIDLENRFDRGQRPTIAEYLERLPVLAESDDRVLSLIYEEFCLLEEHGEDPDSARFCERYEPWRDSLKSQLAYHRELSRVVGVEAPPVRYPRPGDRFGKYQLRSILGIGGAARVYLATEDELGGRKVALKLSTSIGLEPSIMANLDHRNIVPILTVTEPEEGLRGFCMPYRPGVTLEKLTRRLGSTTVPRSARVVWDALQPPEGEEVEGLGEDRVGWSDFPRSGTYPEAVAWIGLSLANALAYLHARGVLHRDIKPANVLLAFRDGPQLLDFNLAHAPSDPEQARAALKGGTLPYMAPEQLRAFLDPADWEKVGAAADLYALGLVLRGLLTGQGPEVPDPRLPPARAILALLDRRSEPVVPVRQLNPIVPPTLGSIIAKCLEFDPRAHYAGASEFAEDLRRFLAREPLKFARNTSILERGFNWLCRNRRILGAGVFAIAAVAVALLILARLPERTIPQREFSWTELRDYYRAVTILDSNNPQSWEQARETFRRLSLAHLDLAWPMLYETVTLEKIASRTGDTRFLGEANRKLFEASKKPDYAAALKQRLKEDPRSVTLLVRQVTLILASASDGEADEALAEALRLLRTAIQIDPGRVDALALLANVEEQSHRPEEAIRHYSRAIEIARSAPDDYVQGLANCRMRLLYLLTNKADALIDRGPSPIGEAEAGRIYDQIGAMLKDLVHSWHEGKTRSTPGTIEYFQDFYGGVIAAGRGAQLGSKGNVEEARAELEEAGRQFEAAAQLARVHPELDSAQMNVGPKLKRVKDLSRRFPEPG